MHARFALHSSRVLLPEGLSECAVLVEDGRVTSIGTRHSLPSDIDVEELGSDEILMPGVVDTHVHLNEPGRTAWEGFATGTAAAAAGGITTLVDMPLNSIPVTTSATALETKLRAAEGQCRVDVGFWGGLVPGNAASLDGLLEAGVLGVKGFLCHSGIEDFPRVGEAELRAAMPTLARHGRPLLVHAELEAPLNGGAHGDPRRYESFLSSRPSSWEVAAVELMIRLCRETRCRVHIVHLSAADALPAIARAKSEGLPISVETCPHYLVLAAEEIPDGATHFKCAPPIREAENRERLWQGLAQGTIDFVACDHSPCTPDLKLPETGDFQRAWGGIAGLQFSLSVVWSEAKKRGYGLEAIRDWLSGRTASFSGLSERKGAIAPGKDGDLVIFAPDTAFAIEPSQVLHRHPLSPYTGRKLEGRVRRTYLRGQVAYDDGAFPHPPFGAPLLAPRKVLS